MVKKIITWVDPEGRYRVTSPAYGDPTNPSGETEDETIIRVWDKIRTHYGLPQDHPFHLVEDADQRARLTECCGHTFRWPALGDDTGRRDGRDGAWEMDTDGRPKVNMPKARGVHMDVIRIVRDAELVKKDVTFMRAVEAGNTGAQSTIATEKQVLRDIPQTFDLTTDTPTQLNARWPSELPARE